MLKLINAIKSFSVLTENTEFEEKMLKIFDKASISIDKCYALDSNVDNEGVPYDLLLIEDLDIPHFVYFFVTKNDNSENIHSISTGFVSKIFNIMANCFKKHQEEIHIKINRKNNNISIKEIKKEQNNVSKSNKNKS